MAKYTIRKDENYGDVLLKDGKDTFCPFTAPITFPLNDNGQMSFQLVRFPCSTNCPHANIMQDEKHPTYNITCCGERPQVFKLETANIKPIKMIVT